MAVDRRRILCVEDDTDLYELIAFFLRDFDVVTAPSGHIAFEKLKTDRFSLIILDYHLPDLSGVDICRSIRSQDDTTPIIFFTADANFDAAKALEMGAQDTVFKAGGDFFERLVASVERHALSGRPAENCNTAVN
jgi:DNA-binding response OmpR family regulator